MIFQNEFRAEIDAEWVPDEMTLVLHAYVTMSLIDATIKMPWLFLPFLCQVLAMFFDLTTSIEDPALNIISRCLIWVIRFALAEYEEWQKEQLAETRKREAAEKYKEKMVDQFIAKRTNFDILCNRTEKIKPLTKDISSSSQQRFTGRQSILKFYYFRL